MKDLPEIGFPLVLPDQCSDCYTYGGHGEHKWNLYSMHNPYTSQLYWLH